MQPETPHRPTELRYRIADFINDRLKILPGFHAAAKAAAASLQRSRMAPAQRDAGEVSQVPEATPKTTPVEISLPTPVADAPHPREAISLENLPFPPLEMRELVGPTDIAAFDNPSGNLVYHYLEPEFYEKVFDFGCGCGRVARQLLLQRPSPKVYVGVDLHQGMIRWCQRNLQPVAPHFSFLHHNVFNTRFNPNPANPIVAGFPVASSQFTLVNALSVFTHLTQEQAVHYLRECARILSPEGVLHASWFFFDRKEFPMLNEQANSLYVSYVDPSAAVIFDREWVRTTARKCGLRIYRIVPPNIRGHQWAVIFTKRTDIAEPEFPPDTAPYGSAAPPLGSSGDVAKIGLEEE